MSLSIDVFRANLIATDGTVLTRSSSTDHSLTPSRIILPEAERSLHLLAGYHDTTLSKEVKFRRLMDELSQGGSNAKEAPLARISLDALHYDQAAIKKMTVDDQIRQHEVRKRAYEEILAS